MGSKIILRVLLVVAAGALIITGVRAYQLKDYVTVLKYPKETATLFISKDSSVEISAYLYVENSRILGAVINVEAVPDSLLLQELNVKVYSTDKPEQSIGLKKVSTVVHPVSGTNGELEYLDVNSFNELPAYFKTITNSGLPYNKFGFYFKARELKNTRFYNFKIEGKFIHQGKEFTFYKEIRTERKLEYHPYRMMT
jgi:hypothetical protein